ncbi:MAG TPA: NAD(P)/FAD-dependent oxidoreductase [Terriglobales bacterium]|nr:NAD(P)/FAD-dependent oxidoreductase [Terriglobales bacterium]
MLAYKQLKEEGWDALVIGSGIGGLTAAALLAKEAGKKVLVLERHYTAGGYTHSFDRPGYAWDVGLHYIGECEDPRSPVRAAFDYLSDQQLQWQPLPDVYDRTMIAGSTFDFPTGKGRLRDRLVGYFPQEEPAIDRYFKAVTSARRASGPYFAEKAIPRAVSWMVGGMMRSWFLGWADRTTLEVLREFTRNQELIGVLTAQWADYGLPPAESSFGAHAIIAAHYFDGASYPVGGASRIAETIAPAIERAGGQIAVSAEVVEILVENRKAVGVRMADGRTLYAPLLISDAGLRTTFHRLVRDSQPISEALRHIPASMAYLTLYVGVKQSAAELGLSGTNLWIHPSFDHDRNVKHFLENPSAEFPVLFISFPSAKDPDFSARYPGRATIEVVTLASYDWFRRWELTRWKRRGAEYDELKRELAARLESELEKHVPAVRGKIDYAELSTPLTAQHFMNYERGEAYGLAATPDRFRTRGLTPHTSIQNLFLTGQDVTSLGVTGALFGGVVSASAILGKNLMRVVTQPRRKRSITAGGATPVHVASH